MRKRHSKSLIALTMALISCTSLVGCGSKSFVGTDATSYPLVNALTQQEVIDYYAKALDYDTVVTRNVEVNEATYVTKEIDGAKAERLKTLLSKAESILSKNEYEYTAENAMILKEGNYNYLKAKIDNYYLTDKSIIDIKGALGYYFIDVEYKLNPRKPGYFTQMAPLVGIDGVFITSGIADYTLDTGYLLTISKKLNEYYAANRIMKAASFDEESGLFEIIDGADPNLASVGGNKVDENLVTNDDPIFDDEGNVIDIDGNIIMTVDEYNKMLIDKEAEQNNQGMNYESIVSTDRKIKLDSTLINRIAGISLKQKAFLPNLETVFKAEAEEGIICGNGIYAAGANGLKVFGFDRSKLDGTIRIRYVFKDATDGTDTILGVNAYIVEEEVTTGFNVTNQNLVIPDFLNEQFEILVDRSDRVMANCDLSGLMNGLIYQDLGVPVLRGYDGLYGNTLKYMSTIRQVIARDYNTNSYLLEIETTTEEGSKAADTYGVYKDKYYIVIQQQGTDFIIVDSVRTSRVMTKEPSIDPDDATTKRLVALNLAGEVTDDAKEAVNSLLSDWYTAGTNRVLYAKDSNGNYKKFTIDGVEFELKRGMYDCFQTDIQMLSTEQLEYMQSQARNQLDKYGSGVNIVYSGTVTEWIGGADNQVEFITEELISYAGREDATYMQVYYLISNMNDAWVVDERTVIDERSVTGVELQNIKDRVGQ